MKNEQNQTTHPRLIMATSALIGIPLVLGVSSIIDRIIIWSTGQPMSSLADGMVSGVMMGLLTAIIFPVLLSFFKKRARLADQRLEEKTYNVNLTQSHIQGLVERGHLRLDMPGQRQTINLRAPYETSMAPSSPGKVIQLRAVPVLEVTKES